MIHALGLSLLIAAATPADRAARTLKFALAVLAASTRSKSNVYPGTLPPRFPKNIPLPGADLLGSIVTIMSNTQTVAIQEDDGPPHAAVAVPQGSPQEIQLYYDASSRQSATLTEYMHRLSASGYSSTDFDTAFEDPTVSPGGFAETVPPTAAYPRYFCKGDSLVAATRVSEAPGVIGIGILTGRGAAMTCAAAAFLKAAPRQNQKMPPLPTLHAPANATMQNTTYDPGWPAGSSALIKAQQTAAEIGDGFAQQMASAGWTAEAPAASAAAFVGAFRKTQGGRHYYATLTVISTGKPERFQAILQQRDLDAVTPPAAPAFPFP